MMPRDTYSAWLGMIAGAVIFALMTTFAALNSLSPPCFSDDMPFNWSVSAAMAAGEAAICLVAGFLLPVWASAIDDLRFRAVILMIVTAGMAGATLAGCICLVIAVCIQSQFLACLTWVSVFGWNTFVVARTAIRSA